MNLTFKNVDFNFQEQLIFRNLNFTFQADKVYALVGRSGIGKSTLLNLIAGTLTPQAGKIIYADLAPTEILTVFQNNQLFPWLTVEKALALPLKIAHIDVKLRQQKVQQLLNSLGLAPYAQQKVRALSGGQQQRVALGQGLAGNPQLLLLDEPTSSLDSESKEHLQQLILKEQRQRHNTVLVVTHDIEEAAFLGDEILLLKDYQLQILANPTKQLKAQRDSLDFYQFCIQLRKEVRDA